MATSNLEALKALYTALGGEADLSAATTSVDVLNAIAELGGGEGGATLNAEAIEEIANGNLGGKLTDYVSIKQTTFDVSLTIMHLTESGTYHVQALGAEAVKCYLPKNDGDTPIMGVAAIVSGAQSLQDLQGQAHGIDVAILLEQTDKTTAAIYVETDTSGIEVSLIKGGIQV